mmetsp:Transcript_3755/g.7044  ORF Transcript_3755/g.7044 Transcript_3755/m.7044 type:complete len:351 (-) Transcript_3755:39-1091(-)
MDMIVAALVIGVALSVILVMAVLRRVLHPRKHSSRGHHHFDAQAGEGAQGERGNVQRTTLRSVSFTNPIRATGLDQQPAVQSAGSSGLIGQLVIVPSVAVPTQSAEDYIETLSVAEASGQQENVLTVLRELARARRQGRTQLNQLSQQSMMMSMQAAFALSQQQLRSSSRNVGVRRGSKTKPPRTLPYGAGGIVGVMMRKKQQIAERKAEEANKRNRRRSRFRNEGAESSDRATIMDLLRQQQQLLLNQHAHMHEQASRMVAPSLTQRILDTCTAIEYNPNQIAVHNEECPICLSTFQPGANIQVLPCGHGGCIDCLNMWFMNQNAVDCPLCRAIAQAKSIPNNDVQEDV